MDRRWQLVLDCLDTERAPFSKGTLVAFREQFIEAHLDRRLIERTIEIANQSQGFGPRALRAALDSSPLWGAGRVEDTYNLVGHALKKDMRVVADQEGRELVEVTQEAGAEVVCETSLKAALDRDWDRLGRRRSVERGLEGVAGRGNLGADPATGRGIFGSAPSGNCSAGQRARCAGR